MRNESHGENKMNFFSLEDANIKWSSASTQSVTIAESLSNVQGCDTSEEVEETKII